MSPSTPPTNEEQGKSVTQGKSVNPTPFLLGHRFLLNDRIRQRLPNTNERQVLVDTALKPQLVWLDF